MPDDRKEPGDALAWSAADWNAWAAAAASAGGAAAGHGVGGPIGQAGGVLRDHTPRSAWARLAGAGSPYDWQEVVRDVAAGTWADGPGSGTASAVEINGVAGLAGTVQRITECGPGEWCFQAVRAGGCTITVRAHVGTCDAYGSLVTAISGASVAASLAGQPSVVGTTDATGLATLTLHAAGTWTVSAAKSGYTTDTLHPTVHCSDSVDLTFCLSPAVTIPTCTCTAIPTVLAMTNSAPGCNGGGYFNDCTIRWQAIPPAMSGLSLGDGTNAFLSDESFVDSLGLTYRYYLTCASGQIQLTRVYAVGPFGGPFRDTIRYTWDLAATGNSCDPFALTDGIIYSGGDPACNGAVHVVDAA